MEPSASLKKRLERWYKRLMARSESEAKQAGSWFKASQNKHLSASQRRELEALGEAWKAWANTLRKHGFSLVQAEFKAPPPKPYQDTRNRPKASAGKAKKERKPRAAKAKEWVSPTVQAEEAANRAKPAPPVKRARAARAILEATGHTAAARAGERLAEQVLEGKAAIPKGLKVPRAPKPPSPAAKARKAKAAAKVDDKLKKTAVKRAYHFLDVFEKAVPTMGHLQKVRLQSLEAMLPSRPRGVQKVAAYETQGGAFELRGVVEGLFALGSRLFPGNKTLEEAWQSHLRQVVLEFKLPKQYG